MSFNRGPQYRYRFPPRPQARPFEVVVLHSSVKNNPPVNGNIAYVPRPPGSYRNPHHSSIRTVAPATTQSRVKPPKSTVTT